MPWYALRAMHRQVSVDDVQVRAAHAARLDLDEDLVRSGPRLLEIAQPEAPCDVTRHPDVHDRAPLMSVRRLDGRPERPRASERG